MPSADERELVARARAGDADAYAQLVAPHRAAAVRTAIGITHSSAEAEDAAQDALVKAHAALDRLDPERPVRPWLLTIVANEARNRARSAGRRAHLAHRAAAVTPNGSAAASDELVVSAEERAEVLAALKRLPYGDREVIGLRYLLELSEQETADALGVRTGTVKSRLSRALSRLRTELGIAAAILAALIAFLAASPDARSTILGWLGLDDDVRIERREPAVPPERRTAPPDLGERVPLSALPWRPLLPRTLGRPDAAYVDRRVPRGALSFTWPPGLILTEIQGRVGPYINKAAGGGTRIERVTVGGEPGYWLAGAPHEFAYLDRRGRIRFASIRLAGDTLLWNRDGILLRLEGAPSKAQALRIARATEP